MRNFRSWLPWAFVIAADGIAVWRGYLAAWWYRRWLHTRVFDPSSAELDYTNARIEVVWALAALGIAAVGLALVLRRQRRQRRAAIEAEGSA